jgi:hypothetical protein
MSAQQLGIALLRATLADNVAEIAEVRAKITPGELDAILAAVCGMTQQILIAGGADLNVVVCWLDNCLWLAELAESEAPT